MRITTWNVNGLRAAISKGLLEWIETDPTEVLCLQEVRARPDQLDEDALQRLKACFPSITWNPAARPGYSGVAVFAKHSPLEVRTGLGAPIFDSEGRVIWLRYPGFVLFNIYFPNGGRDLERVPFKLDFYAYLLKVCDDLHAAGQRIILTGDFNTAHREIDLKNPKSNEKNTGFLPEERVWIDRYLEKGFVDSYRELYPEREQYTWWTFISNARSRGVGWRLDYFLVSKLLHAQVADVVILDQVMGSDHCPVTLELKD
jgi:exodeoxyribonuclease-3